MLWEYFTNEDEDEGLGFSDAQAFEEITSFFSLHVKGVKTIYSETVFKHASVDQPYVGFSFVVRRVKINSTDLDCPEKRPTVVQTNRFCEKNIDVSNFLNLNSLQNHDDYCLAYVFTYRDFTGGTLGLAWVGANTQASGGICEKYKAFSDGQLPVQKSLNTGIVTILNYGSRVPPKVSTLTFAHEIGHNFGSPHDDGPGCVGTNDPKGHYIMFASATSGDLPNNNKFSTCSLGNITLVLDAVKQQRGRKVDCFVESEEAFCGNKIVEENEQCDCGYAEDCEDMCCYAYRNTEAPDKKCQLRPTAQCSPTAGPCCTVDCKKIPASQQMECRREEECTNSSRCNGQSAECPAPDAKKNLTECNDFTQVCILGECQLSICEKIQTDSKRWKQCYVKSTDKEATEQKEEVDKATLCFVACQNPKTNSCVSTGAADELGLDENIDLKEFLESHDQIGGIKLSPGAPCDDFQGYCDVFQKCRGVDADGPLSRLKNLLLSKDTLLRIKDWMIRYWWAVLLIIIGGIILMGLFITACAVHTPSSNPKRPPARKISLMSHHSKRPPTNSANPQRSGGQGGAKGRGVASAHPPAYNPAFQMNSQQPQRM